MLKGRKKQALGRGLSALIPEPESTQDESGEYFSCDIHLIVPNRYQPRHIFSEEELADLCQSIVEQGVIQPLLVRRDESGYELIAGERRLRASKMAGLDKVPVVIKDISDSEMLEMAIVENIQRENFSPMEEADAYQRLIDEFKLTQDQVASRVGKSRPAVANFLRLRQLPQHIKESINRQEISMGHARALLGAENSSQQDKAWKTVIAKRLSVRETENLIRKLKKSDTTPKVKDKHSDEIYYSQLSEKLSQNFGTKVQINRKGEKGKLEIEFYSNSDLERLLSLLQKP
ncbi:MAG: ParB/RepB/Spo0J family partition protein [Proteobacteria bacterium]|nr:ParB/RepB/Spo0J family partition protein [Pseudomonadota bacterium]